MSSGSLPSRRAVIDVGTNSVKLLVADVDGSRISPVFEIGEQTRLGRGFYDTHLLQREAIERTSTVVSGFVRQAGELGAADVRPFATSAARDARNADELISAVRTASGCELRIISGAAEAEWAFRGATSNPALDGNLFLLIDVGGGSTEFILGQGGHPQFSHSFPLGTVRLLEAIPHSDPPTVLELEAYRESVAEFLRSEVQPELGPSLQQERAQFGQPVILAGTGGTASILAMMEAQLSEFDRNRVETTELNMGIVSGWVERLWHLPLEERRRLPGLPPSRADVMLPGAVIFEAVMRQFDLRELRVSTRGVRFTALQELWKSPPG